MAKDSKSIEAQEKIQERLKAAQLARQKAADDAKEAAKEARKAAAQAREAEGLLATRDLQVQAISAYLADRDSVGRRVAVDFGAGTLGTGTAVAQNKAIGWLSAPKPGQPAGWFAKNGRIVSGSLALLEGGLMYGLTLYSLEGRPPSFGKEFQLEYGKGLAQTGIYQLIDLGADKLIQMLRASKAATTQGQLPAG
jgi:hypothetical protein